MGGVSYYPREVMERVRDRLAAGEGVLAVARSEGIPKSTVSNWRRYAERHNGQVPGSVHEFESIPRPPPFVPRPTAEAAEPADDAGPVEWIPSGRGAVIDGLSISQRQRVHSWYYLGGVYPPPEMTPEQSAVVFEAVASGVPVPVAAQRAGFTAAEGEVWASRARDVPGWREWWTALGMASAWAQANLCHRVIEGMAGWQGAARQLIAINPDVFNIKEQVNAAVGNSVEGVDNRTLLEICARQLERADGRVPAAEVAEEVLPLAETGMAEDDER